ncbi:UDP-N-acetylmuramate dehydrogenase [Candidatus Cytomitobacter primus]|uniref:UDP-N-acetylenolpyruvoylglucosamine reductase n=1 Tax=Candidatus Cytomitobacter primus TaxID=2066024 RepID=A0A5C0UF10_9PROT|nr:UDP-N-acetylmuramate dehydrogenase [Candidatus Cytomitobacter primus]QEK38685.1 UDP-N-acetylmuramate dehydrogenase [Candidatus Cytomitobacter primus]
MKIKSGRDLTWIKTGGNVKVFEPESIQKLQSFMHEQIPFRMLGFGSNVIIPDEGLDDIIVKLTSMPNNITNQGNDHLIVDAGMPNILLTRFCMKHGYTNLEFLHTVPGTLGGALYMNAGAYGACISDYLVWAEVIDQNGKIYCLDRHEIKYEYRNSNFPDKMIFLKGCFHVKKTDPEVVIKNIADMKKYRNDKQPRMNTFGSVFKNIDNNNAWKLIQKSDCIGMKIGGAYMSDLHCNFIINDGTASSSDIKELIQMVQTKVFGSTGMMLEREVVFF